MTSPAVLLSERSYQQIIAQLQAEVRQLKVLYGQMKRQQAVAYHQPLLLGKSDGTITAVSGDTLGSGTMQIHYVNHTTGDLIDSGHSITVYNMAGEIADDRVIGCQQENSGAQIVTIEDCS